MNLPIEFFRHRERKLYLFICYMAFSSKIQKFLDFGIKYISVERAKTVLFLAVFYQYVNLPLLNGDEYLQRIRNGLANEIIYFFTPITYRM